MRIISLHSRDLNCRGHFLFPFRLPVLILQEKGRGERKLESKDNGMAGSSFIDRVRIHFRPFEIEAL